MQADHSIKALELLGRSNFEQVIATSLAEEPFGDLAPFTELLVASAHSLIVQRAKSPAVSTVLRQQKELAVLLNEADQHYVQVFRDTGLFNEHNKANEEHTPFSRVFKALYNRLTGRGGSYRSELLMYDELARWLSSEIAIKLIESQELKTIGHWKSLRKLLSAPWQLPQDWIRRINKKLLVAALPGFVPIKPGIKLGHLAWVANTRKRNRPQIDAYESLWNELKAAPSLENARLLCDGGDYVHFIGDRYFELELLEAAGAAHWLRYVDQLKYPILQDHAFIFARDIFFYAALVKELRDMETLTPKIFLLYAILENFVQLLRNTGFEIQRLKNQPEVNIADTERTWWSETVPATILAFTGALLPGGRLGDDLGLAFFQWYSRQTFREEKVGKIFDETVQTQFDLCIENCVYLLDHTTGADYNWKYLQIIQSTPFGERGDAIVCEPLSRLHLAYLQSKTFRWNPANGLNNEVTNQAYHFSVLLVGAGKNESDWELLYQDFRIYHEGWAYRYIADYEPERREAYVFCVGIGMAYHMVKENRPDDGFKFLEYLLDKVIAQDRRKSRFDTAYLVPLSFLLVSYLHHFPQQLSAVVIKMTEKIDDLKLFLNIVGGLIDDQLAGCLDTAARTLVRKRINDEFFVIGEKADEPVLRMQKLEYENLRDRVLSKI